MIKDNKGTNVLLLIMFAYLFSIGIRMYWPMYFAEASSMYYHNQLMINTNDGYYFASGAKDILNGIGPEDVVRASASKHGLSQFTAWMTVYSPFTLEQVMLYLSALVSSLVVIPIVLTGRLMGHTVLGFFAALIGSISWSYYNRTMVGYYDTDMFAIFLQFSIFYIFILIAYEKHLWSIVLATVVILIYPLLYPQGISITYAMFCILILYLILEYRGIIKSNETVSLEDKKIFIYQVVILLSIAFMIMIPEWVRIVTLVIALYLLKQKIQDRYLLYIALFSFLLFLYYSNMLNSILGHLQLYVHRGTEDIAGLHFYQVIQTVREAGAIPFSTIANRISGSMIGFILSIVGFGFLVIRHKPFIIALPLVGIGLFSYIGGLRFTVYAVPIAALSVVYLFWFLSGLLSKNFKFRYIFVSLGVMAMLYPNIKHVMAYKVPTVLNASEVEDLQKLNIMSQRKDYTISWWDYGFPIWYYSDTSTLIDGGKHQNDNFIVSTIFQTTSPELAANLSRLAVETYVDSNYSTIANTLLKVGKKDLLEPNLFLSELETTEYALPKKTRDVYLYMPYRMLNIFPTVAIFGNLDLNTGKAKRNIMFYPTRAVKNSEGIVHLANGIVFDTNKGEIVLGKQRLPINQFIITQVTKEGKTKIQARNYDMNSKYIVVYMQSYGQFIVMDSETFNSMYVQMFILEKYNKDLFELVVSSAYSKIYKIKK